MHLDILTLSAAGSFVAALSALLLSGAWTQIKGAPALLWWAASDYLLAVGISLIAYGTATETVAFRAAGGGLTCVSPALVWAGTRTFVQRPVWRVPLAASIFVWLVGTALAGPEAPRISMLVGFLAWVIYLLASNWELWRSRTEPLMARWPLMILFSLRAVIFLGGIYDVMFQQLAYFAVPPINSWFGLIHLESLIYTIVSAVFMIMMCKERLEIEYIKAAHLDPLTGAANRTAVFDVAERLLARCRADNQPVSVVVFDLDRFKSINDTYGHAVGDRVLISFVTAAKAVLRPNDFLGRYGGEEFVAVLPGATTEAASVVADRIRNAVGDRCRELDGLQLCATVSAGVAAADASATLSNAVELADRALYRAKNRGRNRIESADDSRPDKRPKLIRVA